MKQYNFNLLFGRNKTKTFSQKGFVFTLDLILVSIIVFALILISLFFINKGSNVSAASPQLLRTGSDVVAILEREGTLSTLNYDLLDQRIKQILPANNEMLLRIQGNFTVGNGTLEVGGQAPDRDFIIVGRRASITNDIDMYLSITYFVWGRQQ